MTRIRSFTVAGFRGLLAPVQLDFPEAARSNGIVVYGTNGTGKSSITDAWEWLLHGKIDHLAREGAGERAYPNKFAGPGETYCELVLGAPFAVPVRLTFDPDRPNRPTAAGALAELRALVKHPCHVRGQDLLRFAYLTKAERYDMLASLMGLGHLADALRTLRRVERQYNERTAALQGELEGATLLIRGLTGDGSIEAARVLEWCGQRIVPHSLPAPQSIPEAREALRGLNERIAADPIAARQASITQLLGQLPPENILRAATTEVSALADRLSELVAVPEIDQQALVVELFRSAQVLVDRGMDLSSCPLCGKEQDEDLAATIRARGRTLNDLRNSLDGANGVQRRLGRETSRLRWGPPDDSPLWQTSQEAARAQIQRFGTARDACANGVQRITPIADLSIPNATVGELRDAISILRETEGLLSGLADAVVDLTGALANEQSALAAASGRAQLLADAQALSTALNALDVIVEKGALAFGAVDVRTELNSAVTVIAEEINAEISRRFAEISETVKTIFGTLEDSQEMVRNARLRLLGDVDRAVVLEVDFGGEAVAPAYKYLSESQLMSIGLAVFISSATHFNREFPGILLDDVVNSMDAYKRPQVIKVIQEQLRDRQVLLLTHDSTWLEGMRTSLQSFKRLQFKGYEAGRGPIVDGMRTDTDSIERELADDRGVAAGRVFGPLMEEVVSDLCERTQTLVPFRRRNDLTLDPLMDRLRVRLNEKLGTTHEASRKATRIYELRSFRNLCAHFKNAESPLTAVEVREVWREWQEFLAMVRCPATECAAFVLWNSVDGNFKCPCGSLVLSRS